MSDRLIEGLKQYTEEKKDPYAILNEFTVGENTTAEHYAECVCGKQYIKRITYVIHKKTLKHYIIGSECIGRFGMLGICKRCRKNNVEKPSYNMCIACRRTGQKPVHLKKVKCGKYIGQTYQYVYEEHEDYCNWVLKTPSFTDFGFREYLLYAYEKVEGKPYLNGM